MDSPFSTLLEATLAHLRDLRAKGSTFVEVNPEILRSLGQSPRRTGPRETRALQTSAPLPRQPAPAAPADALVSASAAMATSPPVQGGSGSARALPTAEAPILPQQILKPSIAAPGSLGMDKAQALAEVQSRALVCQKCPHLVRSRTQVVFGVGNVDAELMFVGEAPGFEEDRKGEPFVGPAGQLLTRLIGAMGYSRDAVYIANVLKCRPDLPPGAPGNRAPREDEMDTCKPYLLSQVDIIGPKVIVALGLIAVQGLLGIKTTLGTVRGRWHEFRGIPVMPTFHPSYLLRSEKGPDRGWGEKRKAWEDMLLVLERLGAPITDKMRGYFLKSPSPNP